MYCMKSIVTYEEDVLLPKCMYNLKSINPLLETTEYNETIEKVDLKISNQVIKLLKNSYKWLSEKCVHTLTKISLWEKFQARLLYQTNEVIDKLSSKGMADLERRQDQLLEKLDLLYERIKIMSSLCSSQTSETISTMSTPTQVQLAKIQGPDEIVISTSPDNLPWYLCFLLKQTKGECIFAVTWHIHSSVTPEKVLKVHEFIDKNLSLSKNKNINIRLIFKNGESEMKLFSKFIPIVGDVNILRYFSYFYPDILPYDENFSIDALLDLCHLLQKATEKDRPAIATKLFAQYQDWIYMKQFSIADIAAYNIIKQWPNFPKYVPRPWFNMCEKL